MDSDDDGVGTRRRGRGGLGAKGGDSDSSGDLRSGIGGGHGRKRRRQDESSIFGVFAEPGGDSDGGKGGKGGSRGKKGGKDAAISKAPVIFVRGESVKKTEVPTRTNQDDASGSGDEVDPRFVFDGPPEVGAVEHGPKQQARNKLSSGQMAESYGKGYAMMKKMGFTGGGLGARGEGIANPIEVMRRKEKQALQDEGEKVGQDLFGEDQSNDRRTVEELLGSKPKSNKNEAVKQTEGWKKSAGAKGPRVEYKTAAQVASEPRPMRIVDMRGPEVQIASSFSELAASLSGTAAKSLKELRYNTRQLVFQYEEKVRALAERKRHFEDVLLAVSGEQTRLETVTSLGQTGTQQCRELATQIEALHERQSSSEVSLSEIGSSCIRWREKFPQEFDALQALAAGLALAIPAAHRDLGLWRPLERPQEGFAHLAPWVILARAIDSTQGRETPGAGAHALRQLCDTALLPRLRAALSAWRVREPEACLQLLEHCQAALSAEITEDLVTELVLPRLMVEVNAWDPRVDRMSPHLWVHPWLPMLGSRAQSLWPPIRFKLSACMERWQPQDRSALEMLRPWRQVFDPSNWDPLIEKVLLRLQRSLDSVCVRPDGQDVEPIQHLLAWVGLAPASGLAHVLDVAFFPQWQKALRDWLQAPGCDFSEVLRWYQGWKGLFPKELQEQGLVQRHLASGLEVMKYFMAKGAGPAAGHSDDDEPLPDPPHAAGRTGEASGRHQAAAEAAAAASVPPSEDVSLSLSDYLSEVASEHGLVFRPKKADENGKQVYQFGATSIYLDRSLVHAPAKGGGDWRAVSMDEALTMAKAPQGKAAAGQRRG